MKPTFLVLTDLSAGARRAASLAGRLAAAVEGQLVLMHLDNEPLFDTGLALASLPEAYYTQRRHDIDAALAGLARHLPVPATVAHRAGCLHDALHDLIALWQPQLLVLGLAPEHDLLDALLLNHALPLLRDLGLPLLLVPADAPALAALPGTVAVAADGETFRPNAASQALGPILSSWAANYCVVHVAPPHHTAPDDGRERAEATVRRSGLLPTVRYTAYEVRQHSRSAGIVQAVRDVQADVLLLLARPRTLVGSVFGCGVVAQVSRLCPVPMLVLPTMELPHSETEAPPQHLGRLAY